MTISPISFGSTYRIYLSENDDEKIHEVEMLSLRDIDPKAERFEAFTPFDMYFAIAADDNADDYIERHLYTCGINFHRLTHKELLSEGAIRSRMQMPHDKQYKKRPVELKTDVFDKVLKEFSSEQYQEENKNFCSQKEYDMFLKHLRTGENICVPEITLTDNGTAPKIFFTNGIDRYMVLRDMGFKTIPVALNETSYQIAQKYGLV